MTIPVAGQKVSNSFELHELSGNKVVFSINPINIKLSALAVNGQNYQMITASTYGLTSEAGQPMLPETAALLFIPDKANTKVTVLESQFEDIPGIIAAPVPFSDPQVQLENRSFEYVEDSSIYQTDSFWPANLAVLTGVKTFRGRKIARIQVNPVQYNPVRKTLRVYKTLKIQVTFGESVEQSSPAHGRNLPNQGMNLGTSLFLNYPALENLPDDLSFRSKSVAQNWYNPQFSYYKLYTDAQGIYSLDYNDLINAGIPVETLDLTRLKVFNQGQEIPIRIAGPNGATFDTENILYFYADRHTGKDTFYDLYTDTNAYWLTDGGGPGERYQVTPKNLTGADRSFFHWQTLHLEQDKIFHRSNGSSAIDNGEGWIWRFFFDNDQETIDFEINGAFQEVSVSSLKLRLYGTTRDPVNPDHHVRVSINGESIGETFFDEQTELIWDLTFPTSLLKEGKNQIALHLVPDTGAQINQIYLDWIELVYPRVHAAIHSTLSFRDPAPANSLRQYSIFGFQDPEILVFNPSTKKIWKPDSQRRSIFRVESAGLDDGNYVKISTDFETTDFSKRGHTLVSVNPKTGEVESRNFDTFLSTDESNEMAQFINSLPDSTIILAGIADDGTGSMTENAYLALESLGSSLARQVRFRDSWALVGWKGAAPGAVRETLAARLTGPAVAIDTLRDNMAITYNALFEDTSSTQDFYVAVANNGIRKVENIEKDEPSDLHSTTNGADYIVITHKNFLSAARRLADYRENKDGFRTSVIDVQNIYDEFSYGIIDPQAIKDFLTYAFLNWQALAPAFVVLLGDASWDPKAQTNGSVKTNFVPAYGSLVTDNWFVSLDGEDDVLPDMHIGRIPVETSEQAAFVIDKILAYENLPFDSWSKEMAFFNGGISAIEQLIFGNQATTLIADQIESAPLAAKVTRFDKNTNESITQIFRRAAAEKIQQGVLWANFIGHAASSVWDIDIGQPEDWQNNKIFPFITAMSCHSSRFANPVRNSLAEEFFINPIGAAAYLGSTGFGYITQDFFLLEGLLNAVNQDTIRSLGTAVTSAKLRLWQKLGDVPKNRFVINQYELLGDPAMKLNIPRKPEIAISPEDLRFEKDLVLTSDSTMTISAIIHNYGLSYSDSLQINFKVVDPDGNSTPLSQPKIGAVATIDSVNFKWEIPDKAGPYLFQVRLDPENLIDEEDELNNIAEKTIEVFTSDLSLIKPIEFGIVKNSPPALVTNNSRRRANISYYFELDTTNQFNSPFLRQSEAILEGKSVTSWQPDLSDRVVYFWRARTFDSQNYGQWALSSFLYDPQGRGTWQQSNAEQFVLNALNRVTPKSKKIELQQEQIILQAESAGFLDGNYAFFVSNNDIFGQIFRGHLIGVFDEITGTPLEFRTFDTFQQTSDAEAMAQFINNLPEQRIVLVAIKDEGSRAMTENAYQALERIGSALTRQVGSRDSWAIIGRKGAPIGSVPEALKRSGDGPAAVADTLFRFAKHGEMVSTEIGPALAWKSANFKFKTSGVNDNLQFGVLGKNQTSGQIDTLLTGLTGATQVDISQINAELYPKLQLQAVLESGNGLVSPELNSWAVDFTPPPDLVVATNSLQLSQDTLFVGEEVDLSVEIGNFGLSQSDSFTVLATVEDSDANIKSSRQTRFARLDVDAVNAYRSTIATQTLLGKITVRVNADILNEVTEINETNNGASKSIWVVRDTLSPIIRLTFDGREVGDGEFISSAPEIGIEFRDQADVAGTDTSLVTICLDGARVDYGSGFGQAQFIPQQNDGDPDLKALAIFNPRLAEGDHQIDILAKDASGNAQSLAVDFTVSAEFNLSEVMNYPNPLTDFTEFTYILTQPADEVRIKIYTVSGRLIWDLEFAPSDVGFNKISWDGLDDDGDPLSNGVYFYKIIAKKEQHRAEALEKLVIMR